MILSVVGTAGIWAFGRFFWQRGCARVIDDKKKHVRLPKLLTITTPGEGWDLAVVQRTKVLDPENWHLLVQIIVIIIVTIALVLAGPIAKISLKNGRTVLPRNIEVLQTIKGGGYFGNLLDANVLWNETMKSLDEADFPTDQILDYLPSPKEPWVYDPKEWDPTWVVSCVDTPARVLEDVVGTGDGNMYEPFTAFPRFRDTFNSSWFNGSYRLDTNFDSWYNWNVEKQFQHVFFFIILQSDPVIDDRMYSNNGTLDISITCFDAKNFAVNTTDKENSGEEDWFPIGPVDSVTYTRTECSISRSPHKKVLNETLVPWIWTNNTYSIAMGYRTFWQQAVAETVGRGLVPPVLDASTLFRYYQAYMANTNTNHAMPTTRSVSIWVDSVGLSVIFLTVVVLLTLMTTIASCRYFFFIVRHRKRIERFCVPDGKMEWMIHAAKAAAEDEEKQASKLDRDYFREGLFCQIFKHEDVQEADRQDDLSQAPIARVRTRNSYVSETSVGGRTLWGSNSRGSTCTRYTSVTSTASTDRRKPSAQSADAEDRQRGEIEDGSNRNSQSQCRCTLDGRSLNDSRKSLSEKRSLFESVDNDSSSLGLSSHTSSLHESHGPWAASPANSRHADDDQVDAEPYPIVQYADILGRQSGRGEHNTNSSIP